MRGVILAERKVTTPGVVFSQMNLPRMRAKSLQSCPILCNPWTVARQAPLSVGFSRRERWSGCHGLLQGLFPAQGSSLCLCLLRWQAGSLPPAQVQFIVSHTRPAGEGKLYTCLMFFPPLCFYSPFLNILTLIFPVISFQPHPALRPQTFSYKHPFARS